MHWGKLLFSFEGRVSRKVYWGFVVATIVVMVVLNMLAPQPEITEAMQNDPDAVMQASLDAMRATPLWHWLVQLLCLYCALAVGAKRLHDQDRSAWWNLLWLGSVVLMVGPLVLLVLCGFVPGTPGPNRFGAEPLA